MRDLDSGRFTYLAIGAAIQKQQILFTAKNWKLLPKKHTTGLDYATVLARMLRKTSIKRKLEEQK